MVLLALLKPRALQFLLLFKRYLYWCYQFFYEFGVLFVYLLLSSFLFQNFLVWLLIYYLQDSGIGKTMNNMQYMLYNTECTQDLIICIRKIIYVYMVIFLLIKIVYIYYVGMYEFIWIEYFILVRFAFKLKF